MLTATVRRSDLDAIGLDLPVGLYSTKMAVGEKKVLRIPTKILPSEWVEKHRVLTMSSVPGKWKNSTTPYLTGVMDASFVDCVETVVVCAAPQTGKSEVINNCAGYAIDKKPGDFLFIYPDEQTSRDNVKKRIAAMIESSPKLKHYMTGVDDDISFSTINLRHLAIYTGWARSASRLANKPLPYVVFDETDKYPPTAGAKEASPIALGEKRTRTYRSMRKIWKISTPTVEEGEIWQALTVECAVIFDYWVVCPFCETPQLMVFDRDHFRFPEDVRDPEEINEKDLAWYECDNCREKWDDESRNEAVRKGHWQNRPDEEEEDPEEALELFDYLRVFRPKKIGFHIPSWLSYFVTLSEVCSRFLKGTRDKTALKDFQNSDAAVPWITYRKERQEDVILELKDDRPRSVVPGGGVVAGLTAAADTQKFGFWYEIRAWGWGLERESWCIRDGFVPTFAALKKVLWDDEYTDSEGTRYLVMLTVQDAMGDRTSEVYDFCRLHRGRVLPLKGEQKMNQPFAYTNLEYYPGTKKIIPGGLQLVRVNTTYYKNLLANTLEIAPADPGAWHYHSETTEEWARQMTSEYVDEGGIWRTRPGIDNHAWDISGYQWAACDILGLQYWTEEKKTPSVSVPATPRKRKNRDRSAGVTRPKWMDRR